VVVSIMLVLAAMVTPRVMNVMAETRLRGGANEAASLLQQARMRAIRSNAFVTVRYVTMPVAAGGGNLVYADTVNLLGNPGDGSGDGQYNGAAAPAGQREPLVNLGNTVSFVQ